MLREKRAQAREQIFIEPSQGEARFMTRREWHVGLALAALVVVSSVVAVVAAWHQICLVFYGTVGFPRELPSGGIRPAYRWVADQGLPFKAGHELPEKAENLRGIVWGRGASGIFVRFETDANGIAQIIEAFDRPGADPERMSELTLLAAKELGENPFPLLPAREEYLGVHVFDPRFGQ